MNWLQPQNYNYTNTDAQAIISNQTCPHILFQKVCLKKKQHCVSKYHSAGLINSRVYPLQTDPDTRQTGIKQEALALYNQTSHWCHIQELWQCWYSIYIRTVCSLFALSCNSHPLSYHQLIGSRHMAQLVPHNAQSIAKHKIKQHIFIYIF